MQQGTLYTRLAGHLQRTEGRFSPFNYAIGLEKEDFESSVDQLPSYPLPNPWSKEQLDQFLSSLTFLHESCHAAHHLSTGYGLRQLRLTNIALRYLLQQKSWNLPILPNLMMRGEQCSEFEVQAMDRFAVFLDTTLQLNTTIIPLSETSPGTEGPNISWIDWSAHYIYMASLEFKPVPGLRSIVEQSRGWVKHLPVIALRGSEPPHGVMVTAAILMEAFAILMELNQISNAMPGQTDWKRILSWIPSGNRYWAAIFHALDYGACDIANILPVLACCLDVALMYDPFILYNTSLLEPPPQGKPPDCYPGETFIRACRQSKKIEPPRHDRDIFQETARFYRALCQGMELPDPTWMAQKTLSIATEALNMTEMQEKLAVGTSALLTKAVHAHIKALEIRCQFPDTFPFRLLTQDTIFKVLERAEPCLSFYAIRQKTPVNFDPGKIDILTMHNLIYQALTQPQLECPLKFGTPFKCPSAGKSWNILCRWETPHGNVECLVDLIMS